MTRTDKDTVVDSVPSFDYVSDRMIKIMGLPSFEVGSRLSYKKTLLGYSIIKTLSVNEDREIGRFLTYELAKHHADLYPGTRVEEIRQCLVQ